jgi:hypothetical protein
VVFDRARRLHAQSIEMKWWDSAAAVYQVAQWLTYAALACGVIGLFSWWSLPLLAVPTVVIATAATASAVFAWFRLSHLREITRNR